MKIRPRFLWAALLASPLVVLPVSAETLDTLAEFGNAADANATSGAGTPRGADFTNAATGTYTLTAGGTDFWSATDHGSFIYDADGTRAPGENFSAIVRSVSVAGDPLEALADQWGRTGVMARKTPNVANSANVANIRKSVGDTILQGRPNDGAGTDRAGTVGEFGNAGANGANGSVRNTPIWLALHRVNGQWFGSWADDVAGAPGTWSAAIQRSGTPDMAGEVYVGLLHQSHNISPVVNTAVFEQFEVGPFDDTTGDFPLLPAGDVTFSGANVLVSAHVSEAGEGSPQDANWEVRYLTTGTVDTPGFLQADIYLVGNQGNIGAFDAVVAGGPPNGTTLIERIFWDSNLYTTTNAAGINLFAEAVPGSFGGNQENYGVNLTGKLFVPSDAARDGTESILFHDGVDDYVYVEVDGVPVIDHNGWTDTNGTANGGGTQGSLDVSDPKYDDGEWVPFRMVTWEGGGGDDANLVWDALDRTGLDDVTGAVDATQGSYTGGPLGLGAQVNFPNDPSDEIPSENMAYEGPAAGFSQSGFGAPDMLVLDEPLTAAVAAVELSVNGLIVKTVPVQPTLTSADFTSHQEVTFTLADAGTGGTSDVDESTVMLSLDGGMVTPSSVMKAGTVTTVVYTFPSPPAPLTNYQFVLMANTTAAGTGVQPVEFTTTLGSWPINQELRPGLDAPPNATEGWDMMEFDVIATLGVGLGGGAQMFRDAQTVIRDAAAPLAEATVPVVNHNDPDTNGTGAGNFRPDFPILSDDVGTDDNQYCTLARTIVTIAAGDEGEYTFRISGDDGYGLRVTGTGGAPDGIFTNVGGNGNNTIDSRDRTVAYFANGTGNSDGFAVCDFPAAGDYLIEFFAFEGGGGSYQEISWAKGSFNNLNQSSGWVLLGDASQFVGGESEWGDIPESVLPLLPGSADSGWSTYTWYGATGGSLAATMDYLRAPADPAAATATFLPQLNHSDIANFANRDAGRFGGDESFPGDPTPATDTNDIKMIARAVIIAPVDGDYTIQVRSDDGFLMRWADQADTFHSKGGNGILHPNALNEVSHPAGTGDSNTRAAAFLTAGAHELIFVWWEGGGGSHYEISSAPGVELSQDGPYELLSDTPTLTNLYVGKPPSPAFRITEFVHDVVNDQFTFTWLSEEGASYTLLYGTNLQTGLLNDIDDGIDSDGTTTTYGPVANPEPDAEELFFKLRLN